MGDQVRGWPNFRVLAPVYPGGTDPSHNHPLAHPAPQRQTMQFGRATRTGGGRALNARRAFNPGGQVGTLTVVYGLAPPDDALPPGAFVLIVGEYQLRPWVDFTPVNGNDALTAAAIATAINALPGFEASVPVGATVVVTTNTQGANQVDFRLILYSTFAYITGMSEFTPYLIPVTPSLTAPDIT